MFHSYLMVYYTKNQFPDLIADYARSYGVDPGIAIEQIKRESANFREDVVYGPFVARDGEKGIAQFTPAAWTSFGQGVHDNAYDPDLSLTAWGEYMAWLLNRYSYDYTKALQGYNGGPGNVDKGRISAGAQRYASEVLEKAQQNPIMPPAMSEANRD